jgi:hypothetical protein
MNMCTFITIEIEKLGGHLESLSTRMSQSFMPEGCRDGGVQAVERRNEGV